MKNIVIILCIHLFINIMHSMEHPFQHRHNIASLEDLSIQTLAQDLKLQLESTPLHISDVDQTLIKAQETEAACKALYVPPHLKNKLMLSLVKLFPHAPTYLSQFNEPQSIDHGIFSPQILCNPVNPNELVVYSPNYSQNIQKINLSNNECKELFKPLIHDNSPYKITYWPDGKNIAVTNFTPNLNTLSINYLIETYDSETGTLVSQFSTGDRHIESLCTSPAHALIVTTKKAVTLWNSQNDSKTFSLEPFLPPLCLMQAQAVCNPQGTACAIVVSSRYSGDNSSRLIVWDVNNVKPPAVTLHTGLFQVAYNSEGTKLALLIDHNSKEFTGNNAETEYNAEVEEDPFNIHNSPETDFSIAIQDAQSGAIEKTYQFKSSPNPQILYHPCVNQLAINKGTEICLINPDLHDNIDEGQIIPIEGDLGACSIAYNANGTVLAMTEMINQGNWYQKTDIIPLANLTISQLFFIELTRCMKKNKEQGAFNPKAHPTLAAHHTELSKYEGFKRLTNFWKAE